jgi:uncharacterized membrane protein (DUF4010 family)
MNRMLSMSLLCVAAVLGTVIYVNGIYYNHVRNAWWLFFAMVLVALSQVILLRKQGKPPTR